MSSESLPLIISTVADFLELIIKKYKLNRITKEQFLQLADSKIRFLTAFSNSIGPEYDETVQQLLIEYDCIKRFH